MWEREKISLTKDFDDISANVLEVVDALNNLWYNQELEEKFSDAFGDVCVALDKLRLVRKDFEDLRDKVIKNNVWIISYMFTQLYSLQNDRWK